MSSINYRPDIDGIRAIAVLFVFVHHLSPEVLPGGYVGVDIFFVISGFLITKIIYPQIINNSFSFSDFYERRARRILPALFAVLFFTLCAGYVVFLPTDFLLILKGVLGTLLFSSNVVFWRESIEGYFAATDTGINPLLHTWSLGVEEQFYIVFPLVLLWVCRCDKKLILPILMSGAILSIFFAEILVRDKSVAVFFLSPFRAWELAIGSILAIVNIRPVGSVFIKNILGIFGLILIVLPAIFFTADTVFPGVSVAPVVFGVSLLIYLGEPGGKELLAQRFLSVRPMVYIGLISYSLYLWHWPVIVIYRYGAGLGPVQGVLFELALVSFLLAILSYHFIEKPFRNRSFIKRVNIFRVSIGLIFLFALVSSYGIFNGGFESRFSKEVLTLSKNRRVEIPFVECENSSCKIGAVKVPPTILLWGDSHMLAWAPVFNKILEKKNQSAILMYLSSCPPIIGIDVDEKIQSKCRSRNDKVKKLLDNNVGITSVVFSAYWPTYFSHDGPLSSLESTSSPVVASNGLRSTMDWLNNISHLKKKILIGPVPTYDKSVPLALAIGLATNRNLIKSNINEQLIKNNLFFEVIQRKNKEGFLVFNPIKNLCDKMACKVRDGNEPLYRDSHHLNVYGANYFYRHLSDFFDVSANPVKVEMH